MDNSYRDLESQLEAMMPKPLSEKGRADCHRLIDELAASEAGLTSALGVSWLKGGLAAGVALAIGVSGGWYLGQEDEVLGMAEEGLGDYGELAEFEWLDQDSWQVDETPPGLYVAENGEVRELLKMVEVTQNLVKHRESGVVVKVETVDHQVVDSELDEF